MHLVIFTNNCGNAQKQHGLNYLNTNKNAGENARFHLQAFLRTPKGSG